MITLVSGTNRQNSLTERFSRIYFELLKNQAPDSLFFDLSELPSSLLEIDLDIYKNRPKDLLEIQSEYFQPSNKFIFIIPEYNGSFPGILKLLIDVMDPKLAFYGKKAAFTGIASGRAGNLRGMDHLTLIMHHVGVTVLPFQLPVSRVQNEMIDENHFSETTEKLVLKQITEFINF